MKKISSLALVMLFAFGASAQYFSAGIRTGASYCMNNNEGKNYFRSVKGQNTSWDKEVFFRLKTKGRFAFETSFNHYSLQHEAFRGYYDCDFGGEGTPAYIVANERSQNVGWNFSAQYDVTCSALRCCAVLRNLRSYLGVDITPTARFIKTETTYTDLKTNDFIATYTSNRRDFTVWTGLSNTMTYRLSDRMSLSSVVRFQIDPGPFLGNFAPVADAKPDSRLGLQLGVGYKL